MRLRTGKRNQIRLQARLRGHMLVGEQRDVYGPQDLRVIDFPRQALHSHRLAFRHPVTMQPLSFEAALPSDLAALAVPPKLVCDEPSTGEVTAYFQVPGAEGSDPNGDFFRLPFPNDALSVAVAPHRTRPALLELALLRPASSVVLCGALNIPDVAGLEPLSESCGAPATVSNSDVNATSPTVIPSVASVRSRARSAELATLRAASAVVLFGALKSPVVAGVVPARYEPVVMTFCAAKLGAPKPTVAPERRITSPSVPAASAVTGALAFVPLPSTLRAATFARDESPSVAKLNVVPLSTSTVLAPPPAIEACTPELFAERPKTDRAEPLAIFAKGSRPVTADAEARLSAPNPSVVPVESTRNTWFAVPAMAVGDAVALVPLATTLRAA